MSTIRERIQQRLQQSFVGRTEELATLQQAMAEGGPLLTFVSGIGGIGKSTLLNAFAAQLRAQNTPVLQLDCRSIPPSDQGLLLAMGQMCECAFDSVNDLAPVLETLGPAVAITFDTYEVFRLLDAWLRNAFVPALPDNVRLFFFGREAPPAAWFTAPGWQGLCQHIQLETLSELAATSLLQQGHLSDDKIRAVVDFAQGHPLALKLAAATLAERPERSGNLVGSQVVETLARFYLEDVEDPVVRQALEAASVVRRVTRSLLGAMVPDSRAEETYNQLFDLPFTEINQDGLLIHDLVRQALSSALQTHDPGQYYHYRAKAWRQLSQEWATAGKTHRWRYTADMLYLIEQPMVHNAFFPSGGQLFAVEPARSGDGPAILAIARAVEGPQTAAVLERWWQQAPQAFRVARDLQDNVAGFYQVFDPVQVPATLLELDPIVRRCWQDLQQAPIPEGKRAFFLPRALGNPETGALLEIEAVCWLDSKHLYLEYAEVLYRTYLTFRSPDGQEPEHGRVVKTIEFRPLDQSLSLDGEAYYTYCLNFGPEKVSGWLSRLVDAQYGAEDVLPEPPASTPGSQIFDLEGRVLQVDGDRLPLTPLEFGVLDYLYHHSGQAVSRMTLLEEVWGYDYDGGSNVVDSIVRSLRKKLRRHAKAIATVIGVGYRFDGF